MYWPACPCPGSCHVACQSLRGTCRDMLAKAVVQHYMCVLDASLTL